MGAVTTVVVRGASTAVEPLGSEREPAEVLRTDACWSGSPTAASKLRQQVRHHHQSPLPTQRVWTTIWLKKEVRGDSNHRRSDREKQPLIVHRTCAFKDNP